MAAYSEAKEGQLGCPAGPEVIGLIQARERIFGKKSKSPEELKAIHASTPWVMLRSGVNIKGEGSTPARRYAFCGALVSPTYGASEEPRPYIGPYRKSETTGWRPIPGITSVDINVKDTWGAILEATISLKVMDRETLENIDALYFKPGMVALLEIGHTICVNPEGGIDYTSLSDCLPDDIFYSEEGTLKFYELAEQVRLFKVRNRNYEALCGYITNFRWSIQKDGTYDCTIKLLSQGVVLKGLQLQKSTGYFEKEEKSKQDDDQELLPTSVLLKAIQEYTTDDGMVTLDSSAEGESLVDVARRHPGETISLKEKPKHIVLSIQNLKTACKEQAKPTSEFESFPDIPVVKIKVKTDWFGSRLFTSNSKMYLHYITLRDALTILEFFNIDSKNTGSDVNYFNKNADYDYVDAPYCFSLNPGIAIKPQQLVKKETLAGIYPPPGSEFAEDDFKYNLKPLCTEEKGGMRMVVGTSKLDSNPASSSRILNIWVTLEELDACVRSVVEANTEGYTIYEIVETLLADIQKAFGNINLFKLYRNHTLECWEIVDWNHISVESPEALENVKIRISGTQNTVSEFEIQSEVSDDLANQMSIAATSPAAKDNSTSPESIVHWNENSVSRFVPGPKPTDKDTNKSAGTYFDQYWYEKTGKTFTEAMEEAEMWKKFWELCKRVYKAVKSERANLESYEGENAGEKLAAVFTQLQAQGEGHMQRYVNIAYNNAREGEEGQGSLQNGIIPYKATLTMKGIGGLTVGTVFVMDEELLPSKYKNWGNIITGISHKVSKEGWFTTVKTCYYPLLGSTIDHGPASPSTLPEVTMNTTEPQEPTSEVSGVSGGGIISLKAAHSLSSPKPDEYRWSCRVVSEIYRRLANNATLKEKGWLVENATNNSYTSKHLAAHIKKYGRDHVISIVPHWNGGGGNYWLALRNDNLTETCRMEANKLAYCFAAEARRYRTSERGSMRSGDCRVSSLRVFAPAATDWASGENPNSQYAISVLTENWFADWGNSKMQKSKGGRGWLESTEGINAIADIHVKGLLKYLGIN